MRSSAGAWRAVRGGDPTPRISVPSVRRGWPRSRRAWCSPPSRWRMGRVSGRAPLAALKAGLVLTPEQEKNWPAFEQAARDFGKLRLERMSAMRNAAPTDDPVERLRQRATALSDTGAALKKLAEATDPLYKSLDESQK